VTMNPISEPVSRIGAHYDVVVVGSGYGGGIAASRMARAGRSVCVLERGREILPGDYPNDLAQARAELQIDTAQGRLGASQGLFNLHVNNDVLALVGCGLGGTSLINANVALEMDQRLFADPLRPWPAEFQRDPDLLAPYVERARSMLDPVAYPNDFPPLDKLQALQKSAQAMRQEFIRPPIAVNFVDHVNPFGVSQPRCTSCGDCTSGCNVGAKNTTLMNYLPDAHRHGAKLFVGARVSHLTREGARWRVHFEGAPYSVTGDVVMLGAGSLGSSEILLRSRRQGLPLSDRLGEHFSGNGDVLAFGFDNDWQCGPMEDETHQIAPINGVGVGCNKVPVEQYPGPCITGMIDMRATRDPARGVVVEEGVIPGVLAPLLPAALFMAAAQGSDFFRYGTALAQAKITAAATLGEAIQDPSGDMTQLAYEGAVSRTQTYLVMSVDDAAGRLALEGEQLRIDWPRAGASPVIANDNEVLRAVNGAIRGQFIPNPLWSQGMGQKLVTVHPVGGCGMADSADKGVVDARGRVFASSQGADVHSGLYVCDGAVLPGAAGVNPLLTISALAERICQLLADDRGWQIDLRLDARTPLPTSQPSSPVPSHKEAGGGHEAAQRLSDIERAASKGISHFVTSLLHHLKDGAIDAAEGILREIIKLDPHALSPRLQFTEQMQGWVSLVPPHVPSIPAQQGESAERLAAAWGRGLGQTMAFQLTIATDDLYRMTTDPSHPASLSGTVTCPVLSPEPMNVLSGAFNLLPVDEQRVETWVMTYDMVLDRRTEGLLHFGGIKYLHQAEGSSWWTDLTTLFVQVHDGATAQGRLVAQGVLTLGLEDLLRQASTVSLAANDTELWKLLKHFPKAIPAVEADYLAKFAGFFGGVLFRSYGGLLSDLGNFSAADDKHRPRRTLRAPQPKEHVVELEDGFKIKLTHYPGDRTRPVVLAPGFSVRSSSFATDTVECNLVEFLAERGYDVWLFAYRGSPDSGSPVKPYTIDDIVTKDWPAAVDLIRQKTGQADLQAIVHCVGSLTLLMAMLNGMKGIRSVISSQLTLHPVVNWLSDLKADVRMVRLFDNMSELDGAFDLVPDTATHDGKRKALDEKIDAAAWNIPIPEGEQCKNPVCHRVFSIFGASYAHRQLNHWTHVALGEMFGRVALKPFEQLTGITEAGLAVDSAGMNTYVLPEKAKNLAVPISFVAGALNKLFLPESSARTYRWLCGVNHDDDHRLYTRRVFENYAHMDLFIGRDAWKDVFPYLLGELERGDKVRPGTRS